MKFFGKISHKERKVREDHKEKSKIFVRYLIVKSTRNLRTKTPSSPFVIFVPSWSAHWRQPKGRLAFITNSGIYWCYAMRH